MLVFLVLLASASATLPPSCDSQVYCTGPLLHTVQMARIFNDSKTFVDMKMKESENDTVKHFHELMDKTNNNPTHDEIKEFVLENFENGNELEEWIPPDFVPEPKFLQKIKSPKLQKFGRELVHLWKTLARKVKVDVSQNPGQYSLMPLPNGFVIPGGRFKEIYYWDTYWIIRGLLICEMPETARGIIENFLHLVKKLGHVPNGSRVYYNQRSQPPLLTKMVDEYIKYTGNTTWLRQNIELLEQELEYWIENRMINFSMFGVTFKMFQYNAPSLGPRPESYREDVLTAASSPDPNQTYIQLKSAAESGWDFSSRWFFDPKGGNNANLTGINITRLIPVDLNAFIYDAFSTVAKFHDMLKNPNSAQIWRERATNLEGAIQYILWNSKAGIWQDMDVKTKLWRNYFYVSNIAPLWVKVGKVDIEYDTLVKIVAYLKKEGIENYLGGTPTSMNQTGEQWDMPNAWAPLQSILIESLKNSRLEEANVLAQKLAQLWVKANYIGYSETKQMFEKYDANVPGQFGGGGEYTVQAGFGWTNGVVLSLLNDYGTVLEDV